ncbi:MAG: hypothetical protein EAY75_14505 [Bacteroidetes bacterium]|nr:MAG: hypothetical protein EAY75_14505 [Bacteroidota bacterium]
MKKTLAFGLLITIFTGVMAQPLTIENVRRSSLRSSDAIRQGKEVKGYYFFYISDKVDRKTNEYTLRICDNTLNLLKEVVFAESRNVEVLESSFNGQDLIFMLLNRSEKTITYHIYGADGTKKTFNYDAELSRRDLAYLNQMYNLEDGESKFKGLYPIEGRGFISNVPDREDKDFTFTLSFFDSQRKRSWSYTPTEGAKRSISDYLGTVGDVIYLQVLKYGSSFDQRPDATILGLNLNTGKVVFERNTDAKFRFYASSLTEIGNKTILNGEYFEPDANIMKAKSLGLGFWELDAKGKLLKETYSSWEGDLGKFFAVNSKSKVEDFGYLMIHNIFESADGNIYAVGEGFRKEASALGIASTLLSRGGGNMSTVKLKVTNMMLLKFDKNFKMLDAKMYEKNHNSVLLPSGAEFASTMLLGKMAKFYYGEFDYAYTQTNDDKSSASIVYADYVRSKEYKGVTYNSISINDGKVTTDKVNINRPSTYTWVLPAKTGQILVLDYDRKAKKMTGHFEKLN